jgi:hypothetical protein
MDDPVAMTNSNPKSSAHVDHKGPIERVEFENLSLDDPFFDSLKEDYREFPAWFARKGKEEAWVLREKGRLSAFLYLKPEEGPLEDIEPSRPAGQPTQGRDAEGRGARDQTRRALHQAHLGGGPRARGR